MAAQTPVINWSGDYEETCQRLALHLGRNKIRRKLFNTIYGYGSKPRSRKQLVTAAKLKPGDSQQAQNELDALARYGLIHKEKNSGVVTDQSRYLYSKDSNVRAHRKTIVKFADRPALAKKLPTKRNPVVKTFNLRSIPRTVLRKRSRLNVLYLTANPIARNSLRVDVEMRKVQDEIRGSRFRDNITLHYLPAADLNSLMQGLNDKIPGIVHFSGHGNSSGIAVDHAAVKRPRKNFVTFDLLGRAIKAVDTPPQVVVLNSCHSAGARKSFFPAVKALIAMGDSIGDLAAVAFATKFYGAIAAGQSLKSAFAQGEVAIETVSLAESKTPELIVASGVNPAKMKLT